MNWLTRKQRGWPSRSLKRDDIGFVDREWLLGSRNPQFPIWEETDAEPPNTWLILGGRGAGKTRAGAEWVNGLVRGFSPFAERPYGRIALVGETLADAREVMIDGPSGIRTIAREDRPVYEATRHRRIEKLGKGLP